MRLGTERRGAIFILNMRHQIHATDWQGEWVCYHGWALGRFTGCNGTLAAIEWDLTVLILLENWNFSTEVPSGQGTLKSWCHWKREERVLATKKQISWQSPLSCCIWEGMPEWVHFPRLTWYPTLRKEGGGQPKLHCIGKAKERGNFPCFLDLTLGNPTNLDCITHLGRLLRSQPAVPFLWEMYRAPVIRCS